MLLSKAMVARSWRSHFKVKAADLGSIGNGLCQALNGAFGFEARPKSRITETRQATCLQGDHISRPIWTLQMMTSYRLISHYSSILIVVVTYFYRRVDLLILVSQMAPYAPRSVVFPPVVSRGQKKTPVPQSNCIRLIMRGAPTPLDFSPRALVLVTPLCFECGLQCSYVILTWGSEQGPRWHKNMVPTVFFFLD